MKISNSYLSDRLKENLIRLYGDRDLCKPVQDFVDVKLPEGHVVKPGAAVERYYRGYQMFQ